MNIDSRFIKIVMDRIVEKMDTADYRGKSVGCSVKYENGEFYLTIGETTEKAAFSSLDGGFLVVESELHGSISVSCLELSADEHEIVKPIIMEKAKRKIIIFGFTQLLLTIACLLSVAAYHETHQIIYSAGAIASLAFSYIPIDALWAYGRIYHRARKSNPGPFAGVRILLGYD